MQTRCASTHAVAQLRAAARGSRVVRRSTSSMQRGLCWCHAATAAACGRGVLPKARAQEQGARWPRAVDERNRRRVPRPCGAPTVTLFTKADCTLCDKVKDVLKQVQEQAPHSLVQMDITDADKEEWWNRYKYDIPVLHVNQAYWIKHRLSPEDAVSGIGSAAEGAQIASW